MPRKYCRQRLADPKDFDRRSFRTVAVPGRPDRKIVTGCPAGEYQPRKGVCKVGLKAQSMLLAVKDAKCKCLLREEAHIKTTGKKPRKACPLPKAQKKR